MKRSYTHTQIYCVNCHNMRNLYHIHVIDNTIEIYVLYIHLFVYFHFQAEVKLEYLLNLSILISKGKEIN